MTPEELAEQERNAVVVIKPEWWYYALWYVYPAELPAEQVDWMGCLRKECADPADAGVPWKLAYRFRYYNPEHPGPFAGKDRRSVYRTESPGNTNPATLAGAIQAVAALVAERNQSRLEVIDCQGSGEKLLALMQSGAYEWMHVQKHTLTDPKEPSP
jgi:hypothetical protein